MLSRLRELTVALASTSRAASSMAAAEQHARLGDFQAAQDVLDLACLPSQAARQRSGLRLGLPSVVVGWLARGDRRAG